MVWPDRPRLLRVHGDTRRVYLRAGWKRYASPQARRLPRWEIYVTQVNWRLLGDAVSDSVKHPATDPLAPYREEAYATAVPWGRYEETNSRWNMEALLASMAATLTEPAQLNRLFTLMDEAKFRGHMPEATGRAGDVLLERFRGEHHRASLPDGWETVAERAYGRGEHSSAAFWAGALLRAAGHHAPALGVAEDEQRRAAGDPGKSGPQTPPPAPDSGPDLDL